MAMKRNEKAKPLNVNGPTDLKSPAFTQIGGQIFGP